MHVQEEDEQAPMMGSGSEQRADAEAHIPSPFC